MCGCESWTIKKAECRRIDAFELWVWRRLLRISWTARRSGQSILKEISCGYSLDCCWSWDSNTLATWCKELTHWKSPWCWEWLKAIGEGDNRGWDGWMGSQTWWTLSLSKLLAVGDGYGSLACCSPWGRKDLGMTEQLNWTESVKSEWVTYDYQ